MAEQKHYRPDIDGLRAIAVGGVVACHAMPGMLSGGFVGVDVFFVISGYLISSIILTELAHGTFSFLEFYRRRIKRILPALLVVLAAVWVIGFLALWPFQFSDLGSHILAAATFSSNVLLVSQTGYFDAGAVTKPLLHLWSLAIEEQFYLIWPPALLLAWKLRLNLTVLLIIIIIVSFISSLISLSALSPWSFYGPHNRAWELAIGALIAAQRGPETIPVPWRPLAAAAGLALIATAMFWFKSTDAFPGWRALVPTVGAAFLILAGPQTVTNRLLSIKPMVAIGLISYPLYLWHWPLLSFAHITGIASPAVIAASVAAAVVLSCLTYWLIERPIRFGTSVRWRRIVPAGLAIFLIATASIGAGTHLTNGLAFRLDGTLRNIASYSFDFMRAYRVSTCLLNADQEPGSFTNDCIDNSGAPLLVLWGDSHAGHLYPGFKALESKTTFSLAQFSASTCLPILGVDFPGRPRCRRVNDFVIQKIAQLKPRTVVLASAWWDSASVKLEELSHTIDALRKIGVTRIIVAGPVPVWNPSLPALLLAYYQKHQELPERMDLGLSRMNNEEEALRKLSAEWGVTFFSMLSTLCNAQGCLARAGDDLIAWDSAHLTTVASRYVVGQMLSQIQAPPVPPKPF